MNVDKIADVVTEGNLLLLAIDLIKEDLAGKSAIIGVIVLEKAVSLRHHFLKSLHGKGCFVNSEVSH